MLNTNRMRNFLDINHLAGNHTGFVFLRILSITKAVQNHIDWLLDAFEDIP